MRHQFISEEQFKVIQTRVKGAVESSHKGRKLPSAPDLSHARPSKLEGTRTSLSPYRSKLEAAFASKLDLEQKAGIIKSWRYEPMSLTLAKGKRYRPDFLVEYMPQPVYPTHICATPKLEAIEIKGKWFKNRRDSMTHLRWAAQLYPMFTWRLMQWNGSGFVGEYIT